MSEVKAYVQGELALVTAFAKMNSFGSFIVFATILVVAKAIFPMGEEGPTCKGERVKFEPKTEKFFRECLEEFKAGKPGKDGKPMTGKTCLALCAFTKFGEFDDKGKLIQDNVDAAIDKLLPAKLAGELKPELKSCAETNKMADVSLDNSDNICSPYKQYFNCSNLAIMKTCIENFDAQIWNADGN